MSVNREVKQILNAKIAVSFSELEVFRKMLDEFNQKLVGLNTNYDELVKRKKNNINFNYINRF